MNGALSPALFIMSSPKCIKPRAGITRLSTLGLVCFYLLCVSLTLIATPTSADAFYGNIQRFSVYEGLPEASVYSMANDKAGFLWLGTPSGLVRFDGYEFETYSDTIQNPVSLTPPDKMHAQISLKTPDASNMFVDSKNRIWIGSWGQGLLVYENDLTLIDHFVHNPDDPNSLGSDLIQMIFEDSDGDIWIGTNGGGLSMLNSATLANNNAKNNAKNDNNVPAFTNFKHDPKNAKSLSHDRVWSMAQTTDGMLWVGTSGGLNKLDKNHLGQFTLFDKKISDPIQQDLFVRALKADDKGQLWIGTKKGLALFDTQKAKYRWQFWSGRSVNCIQIDSAGGILVGTTQGFYRWNQYKKQLTPLRDNGATVLLPGNDIRDILVDHNDILWLATRFSGLLKIQSTPNAFQTYSYAGQATVQQPQAQSKPIGRVNTFTQDNRGKIWLGTNNGLMTMSPSTGQVTRLDMEPMEITTIVQGQQGNLWIGGFQGLFSLSISELPMVNPTDLKTKLKDQNHLLGDLADKGVSSLLFSNKNELWIGTNHEGLVRFNGSKTEHYRFDKTDTTTLTNNSVTALLEDHQGNIWIGTNGGALSQFNPKPYAKKGTKLIKSKPHFINYHNDKNQPTSIDGVVVNTLYQTNQHALWVGLQQSLDKLTLLSSEFEHFSDKKGINSHNIKSITEDDQGYLWLATSKGISRYDMKQRIFVNFTNKDGFDNNLFLANAVLRAQDGQLYFGGNKGVTKVIPDRLNFSSRPAVTAISKIWIDHQPHEKVSFTNESVLKLPHYTKDLKFQFTLLDFKTPDKNRYSYRLKGFDNNWHQANDARITSYTNLSPGSYTFEVKGGNNQGIWSDKNASIIVHVATPWWALQWVRTLIVILLTLMVFLLYRYRLAALAKHNAELEKQVARRSTDLFNAKKQLIESQKHVALSSLVTGIAHEINTPVGIGITAISMLQDSIGSLLTSHQNKSLKLSTFESKLLHMQTSADLVSNNLMKSADLINTFKKVSVDQMSEQRRVFDLSDYLQEIANGLQSKLTTKSITITVNSPDELSIDSYPGAIAQVVTNLILNAFIHGFDDSPKDDKNREITLTIQPQDTKINIMICDNGSGISTDQLGKIFDPFYTTKRTSGGCGLGLHICYNIVERLLNGTISCSCPPAGGACFEFDISTAAE